MEQGYKLQQVINGKNPNQLRVPTLFQQWLSITKKNENSWRIGTAYFSK